MANIITIDDLNLDELNIYTGCNETQLLHYYEPNGGLFIAESPRIIERALDAGYEPVSFLVEERYIEGYARELIERLGDIPIFASDIEVLKELTGFNLTRGALCAMKRKSLPAVEEVIKDKRRIVVLEHVENPTNVGAIFRSAAALNMDAVLLTNPGADPLYRRASRVSMGTVFQVPWTFICEETLSGARYFKGKDTTWPCAGMKELKRLGFKTVAMALKDDSCNIDDPRLRSEEKLAIIMGTENDGLLKYTIDNADYTVKIPMSHGVDSLNVAAACAVACWELGKR